MLYSMRNPVLHDDLSDPHPSILNRHSRSGIFLAGWHKVPHWVIPNGTSTFAVQLIETASHPAFSAFYLNEVGPLRVGVHLSPTKIKLGEQSVRPTNGKAGILIRKRDRLYLKANAADGKPVNLIIGSAGHFTPLRFCKFFEDWSLSAVDFHWKSPGPSQLRPFDHAELQNQPR